MTNEQFAELKALLLMTNALLLKLIGGNRTDQYPDLWALVDSNFQRILSQLLHGSNIRDLSEIEVGS